MKATTVFWCKTHTEATDRANLWYIASPTARRMETDNTTKEILIFAKSEKPVAVFRYY